MTRCRRTNGDELSMMGIGIEAIPAYNLTPERLNFHPKGRDNGYVLTFGDKRIYISGDTEGTPEMRALKNIDVAFVCMNLPYTMTPEAAADAVLAFKPKIVYPYHSRGSDVDKFASMVKAGDAGIDVRLRDCTPRNELGGDQRGQRHHRRDSRCRLPDLPVAPGGHEQQTGRSRSLALAPG